ncbi:hypothetical protein [Actinomadura sp. NPDC000600]|uniref:MmyB family transcriptional regulator n=1 Tax=Actinomadura sp. NPDC000600 TaxID=3154262 RepID=UPI00339B2FE1
MRALIDTWPLTPAYIHGKYMDVLAANSLAIALSPFNAPGRNGILAAFLEPEMRELHQDWEGMTARVVPYLRSIAGVDIDDPRLVEILGEPSLRSSPACMPPIHHLQPPDPSPGAPRRDHPLPVGGSSGLCTVGSSRDVPVVGRASSRAGRPRETLVT